jgi:PAS domain S-box-containing protein
MPEGREGQAADVTTLEMERPELGAGHPRLVVVGAPTAAEIGRVFRLEPGEWFAGRAPEVNLRLDDPGISRRHAKFVLSRSGACKVVDLGSKNGTYLNGLRVRSGVLREGDRIRIGAATALRFSLRDELDENEERLRQALAAAGAGTWEWDARTGRLSLSDAAARLLGLDPVEVLAPAADAWSVIHPDDRARIEDGLVRVAETGAGYDLECRVVGPGGERWVSLRGELLRDEGRNPLRAAGVVMDVTERKRAEAELRRQSLVFESLYDGVLVLDRAGLILDANPSAERMLGFARADAVGRTQGALLAPGRPDDLTPAMLETLGREGRWSRELDVQRHDGTEVTAEAVAVPLRGPEGGAIGIVALFRDLTDRKRMEARVAACDRLASLGTLAAGLAHEVNNPLALVVASLTHALREVAGGPSSLDARRLEDLRVALEDAKEGAGRIAGIVRDLAALARPSRPGASGPVDVNHAVEVVLRMARNELRHRCRVETALGKVPPVAGDESRIAQVLLHLVVNAAQAIPEGDASRNEIRIETGLEPDGRVRVEVADTGVGIPPESLGRVFEPFFTTRPGGSGAGLGLSVSQGIVASLGGEIRVESEVGKGTRFRILLPAAGPALAPSDGTAAAPSTRRARVLLVDDEPTVAASIERLIRAAHDVTVAHGGTEALRLLEQDARYDVILCDVMMPDLGGPELFARLSERWPDLARRMVFMSGGAFTERSRSFLERTRNPSVLKPVDVAQLESIIGSLSERRT